jgi:hypothetical protein
MRVPTRLLYHFALFAMFALCRTDALAAGEGPSQDTLRSNEGVLEAPPARLHRLLVDSVHAHNFLEKGLEVGNRDYHSLFGSKDGLDYLARQGYQIRQLTEGTLSEKILAATDSLFINLVSDNLPPFLVEEIFAIKAFLMRGGNVLVITDHSNAYHHTWKLMPLFTELGVRLYNESALEKKPHTIGPGPGWILIDKFKTHPITEQLTVLSFHSGGTVDEHGAVAFLSETGWGDTWHTALYGENSLIFGNRGNYGDFKRKANERQGSLAVVAARNIGLGKFVVVGDQNALGNLWLRFGDNYKLYMNIFRWFSAQTDPADYLTFRAPEESAVLMLDNLQNSKFGDFGDSGLYHAYASLSRHHDTYIHGYADLPYDLVIVSPSIISFDNQQITELREHLRHGKHILLAGNPQRARLLEPVIRGLPLTSYTETRYGTVAEYASGARVDIRTDFARFNNRFIAEPTQEPDELQRAKEKEWLELVNSLLQ